MSYTVQFYLISLEELKRTIGSGDSSLLDQLDFDEEDEEGRLRASELINGDELIENEGSSYGYALEKIVDVLGESVPAEEFEDLRYGEFEGALEWIIESDLPIELPESDDYPYIGCCTLEEIKEALFNRRSADDNSDDEEGDDDYDEEDYREEEYFQDMLENMYEVFRTAVEKQKDIISFYY